MMSHPRKTMPHMRAETWSLGSAVAIVEPGELLVMRLQGWVTAMAYEALHLRAASVRAQARVLVVDHDAQFIATNLSAVEAAIRGTPMGHRGDIMSILVPSTRLRWAQQHCQAMSGCGLPRVPGVLSRHATAAQASPSAR